MKYDTCFLYKILAPQGEGNEDIVPPGNVSSYVDHISIYLMRKQQHRLWDFYFEKSEKGFRSRTQGAIATTLNKDIAGARLIKKV